MSGEQEGGKKGLKALLPDILGILGTVAVGAVAFLVFTNKIPKTYWKVYDYFYVLALVGIFGFLGEKIAITLSIFLVPLLLGGGAVIMRLKPDDYPIEVWWEYYSLLVIFAAGLLVFLFMRWEQTKKMKGLEAAGGNLKARIDPTTAAKYREAAQAKESGKEIKLDGLTGGKPEKQLKGGKKEDRPPEPVDPNETPEQRMEREMRQIKDEFSKKSMKLSTTLLRMKNLSKSLDRDEIFATVVEIIAKGLDADRVQLLLNDDKEGKLRIVHAEGMPAKEYREIVINHEENCIITFLAKRSSAEEAGGGGAMGVKECEVDPKTRGLIGQGTLKTILAAPIYVEGKVFGVVNVERMKNPDYTRDDQNLVATSADIAGLVMKNAKLYSATMDDLVSTKKLSEEQLKKNEELKGSLSRIVSPSVAEMIMSNPDGLKLGGSKSEVTMFFSDIRGFTKMSESMDPTDIVAQLNVYFTRMTDILMELDGTLDKYVGDELMALFGAPVARPDDPIRAVLTGVRMLDALRELQEVWKKEGKPVIQIGIGINTGEVTAGYMGSEKQLSYTVIGDNVNLAARVMANAKPMQMLITKVVYERVKDYFDMTQLESIMVKGKSMPIEIFLVNGVKEGVDMSKVLGKDVGTFITVGSGGPKKEVGVPTNLTDDQKKVNIKIDDKPKVLECGNCGTENDSQTKFCRKCGMPIF
ncbi:MAG: GAF domain-containing protein [Candidatus Riflebacteria bacterium]|nr:GAF domain-containing protein [Candidatus Riflebacteria bacterium]